ncbi:MAG TPA: hypothetical protein VK550_10810 [Polyangiaceae bacterium]|nr:hypothetical protein [Polyangiaceae bacterium]
MRRTLREPAFAICALTLLLNARQARATRVAVDLLAGYGFNEAYRVGFGARGGFTLAQNVYVGGAFVLHQGRTGVRTERGATPQTTPLYFGPEGGYDFQMSQVTLRTYLGVGYALILSSIDESCSASSCPTDTSTGGALAIWPGAALIWSTNGLSLGADVRYVAVLGSSYQNAPAAFATAGLRF